MTLDTKPLLKFFWYSQSPNGNFPFKGTIYVFYLFIFSLNFLRRLVFFFFNVFSQLVQACLSIVRVCNHVKFILQCWEITQLVECSSSRHKVLVLISRSTGTKHDSACCYPSTCKVKATGLKIEGHSQLSNGLRSLCTAKDSVSK